MIQYTTLGLMNKDILTSLTYTSKSPKIFLKYNMKYKDETNCINFLEKYKCNKKCFITVLLTCVEILTLS